MSEFDSGFAQHLCAIVGCHIWMLVFFCTKFEMTAEVERQITVGTALVFGD